MAVRAISIDAGVRLTLIYILADVRLWIKDVSFGTLTGETAWCVSAQTVVTQLPVYQTFINIDAVFARQVYFKAFIACAFVCPQHVLTHPILADVRVEGTLIDISPIAGYANTIGAQSQELSRALWWAGLAGLSIGVLCAGAAAL